MKMTQKTTRNSKTSNVSNEIYYQIRDRKMSIDLRRFSYKDKHKNFSISFFICLSDDSFTISKIRVYRYITSIACAYLDKL